MVYKILLAKSAEKELDKASQSVKEKVVAIFDVLQENPYAGKVLSGELIGLRSLKAWPYRIIYQIVETKLVVHIVRIRHRKDAYR